MSKKTKEIEVISTIEETSIVSITDMFRTKDLLKDGSNLNIKVNPENHYFQHVHRLDPDTSFPFYYVVTFDGIQYKGGPYKDIYEANRNCAVKLYELHCIDDIPIIECEKPRVKKDEPTEITL